MLYLPPAYVTLLFLVHVFFTYPLANGSECSYPCGQRLYVYEAAQVYHVLFDMREFKVKPTRTDGVFVSRSVCNVSNGVLAFVPQKDPRSTKLGANLCCVLMQERPPGKHAAWAGPVTGPGCYGWPTCRRDPGSAHPTYHGFGFWFT